MGSIGSRVGRLEVVHALGNDDARRANRPHCRSRYRQSNSRGANRGSARNRLNRSISKLHRLGRAEIAWRSVAEKEGSGLQSRRPVEQHVVPNGVLVINSRSASDYGLPGLKWIPGKSDLRSEVSVGLVDGISKTRQQGIKRRNRRKVAIRPSRIAHVANAVGQSEVRLNLP